MGQIVNKYLVKTETGGYESFSDLEAAVVRLADVVGEKRLNEIAKEIERRYEAESRMPELAVMLLHLGIEDDEESFGDDDFIFKSFVIG